MSTELLAMRPEAGELLLKELLTYNYGLVLGIFTLTFAFYIALAKLEIIEFLEQKKFLKYPLWRWFLFVSLIGNLSWVWASLALYKAQIIIVSGEKSWNCPIVLINAWFNDCGTGVGLVWKIQVIDLVRFLCRDERPKTAIRDNGPLQGRILSRRQGRAGEGGNAPHRQKRYDAVS